MLRTESKKCNRDKAKYFARFAPISNKPLPKYLQSGGAGALKSANCLIRLEATTTTRKEFAIAEDDAPRIPSSLTRRATNVELPFSALPAIQELRQILDDLEEAAVDRARDRGASWDEVAEAVGVSRQTLQHRMKVRNGDEGS